MAEPVRVLVVDDEALVRVMLRAALEREPRCRAVGEAADGAEALAAAQRLRPDAVVLDLAMPGLDGLAVATRLRERRPGCAIVVFSASEDARGAAMAAGADRFVAKVEGFDAAVAAVLELRQSEGRAG
jgi:DNA-binding NarL/FixJ family response regulator